LVGLKDKNIVIEISKYKNYNMREIPSNSSAFTATLKSLMKPIMKNGIATEYFEKAYTELNENYDQYVMLLSQNIELTDGDRIYGFCNSVGDTKLTTMAIEYIENNPKLMKYFFALSKYCINTQQGNVALAKKIYGILLPQHSTWFYPRATK
jgi:hypothetical protein